MTLKPIEPVVVSTVDNGNLAAALYTLRAAALDLLKRPLLRPEDLAVLNWKGTEGERAWRQEQPLPELAAALFARPIHASATAPGTPHAQWLAEESERRRAALAALIESLLPWLHPQFATLMEGAPKLWKAVPALDHVEAFCQELLDWLDRVEVREGSDLAAMLRVRVAEAQKAQNELRRALERVSEQSERFAEQMDFCFLFVESRNLLSNGFDMAKRRLHTPCFDLLASEARMAAFLAVAKGDIPQQSWFRLDRSHVLVKGRAVLVSWTATMFEYLMPTLWMHTYPDTLLSNSIDAAIQVQMDHIRRLPWGISESGYATTDENGRYFYQAWGIPSIALKYKAEDGPVISPYSTYLALPLARKPAMANLRRMTAMGWGGEYGLYEAADCMRREGDPPHPAPRLVRSWMAHHMGMSLLAIANTLHDNVFRRWFHANPRVRAAEQLLHEKPLTKERIGRIEREAHAEADKAA